MSLIKKRPFLCPTGALDVILRDVLYFGLSKQLDNRALRIHCTSALSYTCQYGGFSVVQLARKFLPIVAQAGLICYNPY